MADQKEQLDGKQRVAFELMNQIALQENNGENFHKPDPRTYYLTLYRQCYLATSGSTLSRILKGK